MRMGCSAMLGCTLVFLVPVAVASGAAARLTAGPEGLAAAILAGGVVKAVFVVSGLVAVLAASGSLRRGAYVFVVAGGPRVIVALVLALVIGRRMGLPAPALLACLAGCYLAALVGQCVWLVRAMDYEYGSRLLRRLLIGPDSAAIVEY